MAKTTKKIKTHEIDDTTFNHIKQLCRQLVCMNPRNTNREGDVMVGPGSFMYLQETSARILNNLEEKTND